MTDLHALIHRMADELDHYRQLLADDRRELHPLATEARAALAEPEPEWPTDEELNELWNCCGIADEYGHHEGNFFDFARAVLARWGNHPGSPDSSTRQPILAGERPGPEDFDTDGRCWWFLPECPGENSYWILAREVYCNSTHWLPAHALPLPSHD